MTHIGFTGKWHDDELQLDYFGARYYDASMGRFVSIDPAAFSQGNLQSFNRYAYANNNPYKFVDPDGRWVQALWGAPIGAGTSIVVQMVMSEGSVSERFNNVNWGQVGVATLAGAVSGGVSAIASTAASTSGAIVANAVGNAAVGAVATQASAQIDGRTASMAEVATGAATSGLFSGVGAAIAAVPKIDARSASAGMTQIEQAALSNLLGGVKKATPDFKYTDPFQTFSNATGAAVSASPDFAPILDEKKP
jgi:RHS repeat-associated protein